MAISRTVIASLLLSFLLLQLIEAQYLVGNNGSESPLPQPINCEVACKGRCKSSSRPNLCNRACGSCCGKCKCVPPGTAGNYETCPCYASLTTGPDHIRKCP